MVMCYLLATQHNEGLTYYLGWPRRALAESYEVKPPLLGGKGAEMHVI